MNTVETVYTVSMNPALAVVALASILLVCGALLYALRTGKLSGDVLATGTAMLEGVHDAAKALAKATGNPAINAASFIFKATAEAAHAAEQMHRTGEIGADERNAKAKEIAENLLELAGIDVTEDRKAAIAVLLEAECDVMGHALVVNTVLEEKNAEAKVDLEVTNWTLSQLLDFAKMNGFVLPTNMPADEESAKAFLIECMFGPEEAEEEEADAPSEDDASAGNEA